MDCRLPAAVLVFGAALTPHEERPAGAVPGPWDE